MLISARLCDCSMLLHVVNCAFALHFLTRWHWIVGLEMQHVVGMAYVLGCRWCLLVKFLDFLSGVLHVSDWDP